MDMGNRLGSESPIRESMLCVERWKSAVFQAGVGLPEDEESDSQEHVGLLGLGSLVLCTNLCGGRLWVFQVEAHGAVAEVRSVTGSAGHVTWLHQLAGSKEQGAMVVSKATDMLGA